METKLKTPAVEFSYFRLSLLSYLRDMHPDKADDMDFIATRGDAAASAYSETIKSGHSHHEAEEISSQILYEGLHFSVYRTIINILWEEFSEEIDLSESEDLAIILLPRLSDTISKYTLSDDFVNTPEYSQLYTELTGEIQIRFEDGI